MARLLELAAGCILAAVLVLFAAALLCGDVRPCPDAPLVAWIVVSIASGLVIFGLILMYAAEQLRQGR
jgi:hypothetical protein